MSNVAHFDIKYTQILDHNGCLTQTLPEFANCKDTLLHFYHIMTLVRRFDKKAIALQRTGKMGTYAPIFGQEAIGTAIGHALDTQDVFVPYYRDYATMVQRGVKLSEILSYWGGDERGSQFAEQKHDLPFCVPIASQCLHAAGIAFTFKYKKQAQVALVCIGDGGTSEGDFYEALNVAGLWKLPIVFVINNNQWAISVPLIQQTACQTLAQKAIAAGFVGEQVDGNDILACRSVIGQAVEKARNGCGPQLIEALTYRLSDHTTADDATRYQQKEDVKKAALLEPLLRYQTFLENQKILTLEMIEAEHKRCDQEINESVENYLKCSPQPISNAFDYHFATLPDYLIEQRATAIEEETNRA